MNPHLRIVRALVLKEYRHIVRDPRALVAAFSIPITLLLLFGYGIRFDVKRVEVGVWDEDRSQESRQLLGHVFADGTMVRTREIASEEEADRALLTGSVKLVLHLPEGFGRDLLRAGNGARVQAILDGTDGAFAGIALAYVQGAMAREGARLATVRLEEAGLGELATRLPVVTPRARTWFNEDLDSTLFTIPGLIAIIVMMLAAQLTSLCVAREFERGTIEPLIASPMAPWELVVGKLLAYLSIGLGQVVLVTLLGIGWFGVPFRGSVLLFATATGFFLVGSMAIGLLLSIVTRSQQVAQQIALVATMLPSLLLSGFIFPTRSMPVVLQAVSFLVPARWFLAIVRGVMLRGAGWSALLPDLAVMVAFSSAITFLCVARFRKWLA